MKLSSRGFSLPEIIIAMGLVAGISLVTMRLMEQQSANEAFIKANVEIDKTVSIVQQALNNLSTCRDILGGKTRSNTIPAPNVVDGDIVTDLSLALRNSSGVVTGSKVLLSTPTAANLPAPNDQVNYRQFYMRYGDIRIANTSLNMNTVAEVVLRFRYNRLSISSWGNRNDDRDGVIMKRLRVVVTMNGSNVIQTCGPLVSAANVTARQKFCEDMGAAVTWDPTTSRCTVNQMDCPWGTVPSRFERFGPPGTAITGPARTAYCVPLHDRLNLNEVFDSTATCTSTGRFTLSPSGSGGRIRVLCP